MRCMSLQFPGNVVAPTYSLILAPYFACLSQVCRTGWSGLDRCRRGQRGLERCRRGPRGLIESVSVGYGSAQRGLGAHAKALEHSWTSVRARVKRNAGNNAAGASNACVALAMALECNVMLQNSETLRAREVDADIQSRSLACRKCAACSLAAGPRPPPRAPARMERIPRRTVQAGFVVARGDVWQKLGR